jgi:hypothetical protein
MDDMGLIPLGFSIPNCGQINTGSRAGGQEFGWALGVPGWSAAEAEAVN